MIICFLGVVPLGALAITESECLFSDSVMVSESPSPSGEYIAGTFLRDGGLGDWVTYVTLRKRDGSFGRHIDDAILVLGSADGPALMWSANNRLLVRLGNGQKSRIMRQKFRWKDLTVEYEDSPGRQRP